MSVSAVCGVQVSGWQRRDKAMSLSKKSREILLAWAGAVYMVCVRAGMDPGSAPWESARIRSAGPHGTRISGLDWTALAPGWA